VDATDLCFTSAVELAELIRRRALSPVEVTRAVLGRIERLNPRLGAYVLVHAERALDEARAAERAVMAGQPLGPLHGVPVSIKDNLWTAGERTTYGSRLLAEFVAPEDAPSVAALRASGAIFVGRTNLPEFAWRGSTDNQLFGESRNPWDLTRTPGGSTGGGAAAVAAGLGPLALGSDGAGSIRIPASFCGLVGLKPTFGRVPMYPAAGGNELVAHVCPLARTVRDAALMMNAIARHDRRDVFALPDDGVDYLAACNEPLAGARGGVPVRIAWSPDLGFAPVEPETRKIAETAARAFSDIGLAVEEAGPDLGDPSVILKALYGGAQAGAHAARSPEQKAQMDPELVRYAEASAGLSVVDYLRAVGARQALTDALRRFFERYDLLLTPTLCLPAFPLGLVGPREMAGREVTHLGWTLCYPFNYSGQPAVSAPAGWTASGLPVGLQIVGRRLEDALVLRAAAAFEALRPWAHRRPPEPQ
jgi:aspartyl-tRNA(Asn)/glutamyl-tRNA(Gln) amidotransferase subunit A